MVLLTMTNKALIGFVGLGNMGAHMAKNLMKKGNELIVFDVNSQSVKELVKLGAKSSSSPADLASKTKHIITMLPSHPHVNEVFTSKSGILSAIQKETLCIDCSTIDVVASRKIASLCEEKFAQFNDAPVSGGVKGAENATLTFMCGAKNKNEFEKIKPILECMGKNIVHSGNIGHGLAAKICNNMMLGISMIGVAETMNLGIRLGLDKHVLAGILNTSSARCWSSDTYNPCPGVIPGIPPSNNYEGGFQSGLMTKDLSLAMNAAIESQSSTPLGSMAYNFYKQMSNQGYSKKDMGFVYEYLKNLEK
jgi:3-hydroxyisobutyrate dehydrogenase